MKSSKSKKIAWIKLPINLMDERVVKLIDTKGVAGYGVYILLLQEMYRCQSLCLTQTQLKNLKFTGATKKTLRSVVNDFNLFCIDKYGHFISTIEFTGVNESAAQSNAQPDESSDEQSCEQPGEQPDCFPSPAHAFKEREKEIDKEILLKEGAEDYIAQIPLNSVWADTALVKSGFGALLKRNWDAALQWFRSHVIANCTEQYIRSVDDAKQYFYRCITNIVSGNMLRKWLEELEREHPERNPYVHEDASSAPGRRSYHGMALPDDAPPRPGERSEWDDEKGCWCEL